MQIHKFRLLSFTSQRQLFNLIYLIVFELSTKIGINANFMSIRLFDFLHLIDQHVLHKNILKYH